MLFIAHSLDSTTAQLEVTEALYEGCKIREGYYDSLLVSHTLIMERQDEIREVQSLKISDLEKRQKILDRKIRLLKTTVKVGVPVTLTIGIIGTLYLTSVLSK